MNNLSFPFFAKRDPLMGFFLLFFSYSFSSQCFSQDLKIVYDAEKSSYRYFHGKEEINKPIVKKGGLILLEVQNYNNYLYDVEFNVSHESFKVAQGSGLLGGVDGLGSLLQGPIFSQLTDSDADGVVDFMDSEPERAVSTHSNELSARELKIRALEQQANSTLSYVHQLEVNVKERSYQVVKIKDQRALRGIAIHEVEKIKYHPQIPPSKIKQYSKSYFEKALDVRDIDDVSISYILEKQSDKAELNRLLRQNEDEKIIFEQQMDDLAYVSESLLSMGVESQTNQLIKKAAFGAPRILEEMADVEEKTQALLEVATEDKVEDLINMWYEYEAISSNTFSKSFRAQGSGDLVNLDLNFILKDSLRYTGAPQQIHLSPINVPVYGGIKINASVGLNFGAYLNQTQTYFLRDSTIRGQDGDRFLPYITSFIHFYGQGRKSVSLGGALGIGIPLSESTGLQSTTFFLGPSLLFGNSERLVLNFGLMGGKVNRLARGYAVGDVFENSEEFIPQRSVYELGLFAGLSFNIAGN